MSSSPASDSSAATRACRPGRCRTAPRDGPRTPRGCAPPSAATAPSMSAPAPRWRARSALVEDHDDVAAERLLDRHGFLGAEKDGRAVDRGAEADALLAELAHRPQAEDLETAGIGQDRPLPAHEAMQAAHALHHFDARTQHQVEGIGEHDLGTGLFQRRRIHALHRPVGADGHEGRGVDDAARQFDPAAPRGAVAGEHGELHGCTSIASP